MFLSVLVISLLLAPCIANALDINDNALLLYLPFNDDTDDYSNKGNHGTISGDVKFVEGKCGEALEFSGAGEVKSPYIPLNEKSFTVCMWVMPALAGEDAQCIFTQKQANATNTSLHFRIYNNGTIRMGFYSNDLNAPGAAKAEWIHLCFWMNAEDKSRKIYVNGEEKAQDAGQAYAGNAGDTMIGSWDGIQRFTGLIDEVQVWDRALSEDEILQSMEDLTACAVDAFDKLAITWGGVKALQY